MNINEHAACSAAFKQAFGQDLDGPTWQQVRELDCAKVMAAILRVQRNPLTKFNSRSLLAGLVMQATRAKGKRSRLVGDKT